MSMSPHSISIIVPAYNEASRIGKLLDVLNGLDRSQFQIIVVDDGSTDETSKVVSSYPDIKCIQHQSNLGKGAAMATGIENALGDIILFIDADLVGFRVDQVTQLVNPLLSRVSQASMGYLDNIIDGFFGKPLCGNRAYFRSDLVPLVEEMKSKRYRVEIFLNYHLHDRTYSMNRLYGVTQPLQPAKYKGVKGYFRFFYIIWQVWLELIAYPSIFRSIHWAYLQYYFV
jgi:glycosyltransferase involved in cell wall biosynthesis